MSQHPHKANLCHAHVKQFPHHTEHSPGHHMHLNEERINQAINFATDDAGKAWREKQWKIIDQNGNGIVSLSEYENWLRNAQGLEEFFWGRGEDYKVCFRYAMKKADEDYKDVSGFIHKNEFRSMLQYTRLFLYFFEMFDEVVADYEDYLNHDEFIRCVGSLNDFGACITNAEAEWAEIDTNKSGKVHFYDKFLPYAMSHKLHYHDHKE